MSDAVLFETQGTIAIVTLNRPDQRNSMSPDLLDGFARALDQVLNHKELRCVIITGRGSCFSAGADLKGELQRPGQLPHERSYAMYVPFLRVLDIPVPVIGALNGHTVGGGLGLALVCDIRVGCQDSQYGANFAQLGFHPGMAITHLLPRAVGASRAAEMLYAGEKISGTQAAAWGLLSYAVPKDQVFERAWALADRIASNAPIAVRLTKQTLQPAGFAGEVRAAAYREAFAQAATLETKDSREGIAALLEKRPARFSGI